MSSTKDKDSEQLPKEKKLDFLLTWKEICKKQKGLMIAMIVLLVASAVLLIFALTTLRPQNAVVIVGYGDVTYRQFTPTNHKEITLHLED